MSWLKINLHKNHSKIYLITFLFLTILIFSFPYLLPKIEKNNDINEKDGNDSLQDNILKAAGYDTSHIGSGADIDVVAHQSYKNDSYESAYFDDLDSSSTFTVPAPTEPS